MGKQVGVVLSVLSMVGLGAACARTPVVKDRVVASAPAAAVPAPPVERAPPQEPPVAEEIDMVSVFFDFDSYLLKPESGPLLQEIATKAKQGSRSVRIEGHCDERGTPEYNLALGEGRARSVEKYLERLGTPTKNIKTVSFGSQRPRVQGSDESAWSQNRRGDVKLE